MDNQFLQEVSAHGDEVLRVKNAELLASEFSEFILAASRLENSYRLLQGEVATLSNELSERNAALKSSMAENERMHLALQQIVNSMPCGVLVANRQTVVTTINPECKRLLGLSGLKSSKRGYTLKQISQWSGVHLDMLVEDAAGAESAQEFCIRDAAGSRWIEVRNRRLVRNDGRANVPDQSILILRDITAQKRAEQEREASRRAMALAEITSMLAHEIRNPLASLELFAELIDSDQERRSEWISNLRAGIRSLSGTVNNVLTFHGTGVPKMNCLDIGAVIERAMEFARPMADQAGVLLAWSTPAVGAKVNGNEAALQQVVLNLISNAIRHTPMGGSVTVSVSADGEWVEAAFCDTGSGIRSDQIERVFEAGFSGSGDSSGLGLAVCERIMRQHEGQITAENVAGSGAQFVLSFPVLKKELARA